jgi:hypothetical protein
VSAIVFGGAPPQLNANGGGGGGGQGQPFAPCRDCGAQLQLVLNAEGPPSILCSAYPMHRLRIDLPRCTSAVAISGEALLTCSLAVLLCCGWVAAFWTSVGIAYLQSMQPGSSKGSPV